MDMMVIFSSTDICGKIPVLSVVRQKTDPVFDGVSGIFKADVLSFQTNPSAVIAKKPVYGGKDFFSSASHQACHAQDLAFMQFKRNRFKYIFQDRKSVV